MANENKAFPHPLYERYVLSPFYEDAEKYYYTPMLAANRAHVVMLFDCDIITRENATALLNALSKIEAAGLEDLEYQSGVEDLFFTIEKRLIADVGAAFGGNLQLARSRNDLGYALTRLALRTQLLSLMEYLLTFREGLLDFAQQHTKTLMPGYTHTQPAQPTTMAHYIAGFLASMERDTARLRFAYDINNQSPLGAAAFTGTGFPINRILSAELLGFGSIMESTYDGIAASDNLTDVAFVLMSIGTNLSRFTHDMLFWATREAGAIRIDDSFIQISSIMPQKRNPVVLEHLRARMSRLLGQAQTIVTQCHSIPFGDTQDIEDELFPPLFGGIHTAIEILHLYHAVIATLQVNVEHLRERSIEGFTTVTELADTLVREAKLAFRDAHSIVSHMVTYALKNDLKPSDLDSDLLAEISEKAIGQRVVLSDDIIKRALDPEAFVEARTTIGGSAPDATAKVLEQQFIQLDVDSNWLLDEETRLTAANDELLKRIKYITAEEATDD